jgi:hypothetical protein
MTDLSMSMFASREDYEKAVEREALPQLPEPAMRAAPVGQERWPFPKVGYFTADQMRAYAAAALATQPPAPADRVALAERLRLMASSWRTVDTAGTIWATLTIDRDAVCSTLQRAADAIAASDAPPTDHELALKQARNEGFDEGCSRAIAMRGDAPPAAQPVPHAAIRFDGEAPAAGQEAQPVAEILGTAEALHYYAAHTMSPGTGMQAAASEAVSMLRRLAAAPPQAPAAVQGEPTRETLAGLLAALHYGQYADNTEEKQLRKDIECALRDFDIGLNEFASPPQAAQQAPLRWSLTMGKAWEAGPYLVAERVDGRGWNATALIDEDYLTIALAVTVDEAKAAAERHAAAQQAEARCPNCGYAEFPGQKRGVRCTTCDGSGWIAQQAEAAPAQHSAGEALTDEDWYAAVREAEHLCPHDLPHLDKQRWKATHIRIALAKATWSSQ